MFEWLVIQGGHDDDELSRVSSLPSLSSRSSEELGDILRSIPRSISLDLVEHGGRRKEVDRGGQIKAHLSLPSLSLLYLQDSENNTILHLLASLPSKALTPPHRIARFDSGCAIRMASIYYDRCSFPPPLSLSLLDRNVRRADLPGLSFSTVSFVLDWANTGGKTAMHVAAQEGNQAFVQVS